MSDFNIRVKKFNQMYGLSAPSAPTWSPQLKDRLIQFKKILQDELNEVDDIIDAHDNLQAIDHPLDLLTMLADWLGDIQVYAASEMVRHGLPIEPVLDIIMDSNDSKLDEHGNPIVKDGKVQKGPNYWKPEPKIRQHLQALFDANRTWSEK